MDSPIQYGMYIAGSGATVQGAFTEFNAGTLLEGYDARVHPGKHVTSRSVIAAKGLA